MLVFSPLISICPCHRPIRHSVPHQQQWIRIHLVQDHHPMVHQQEGQNVLDAEIMELFHG